MKFSMLERLDETNSSAAYSLHPSSDGSAPEDNGIALVVNDLAALDFQYSSSHIDQAGTVADNT